MSAALIARPISAVAAPAIRRSVSKALWPVAKRVGIDIALYTAFEIAQNLVTGEDKERMRNSVNAAAGRNYASIPEILDALEKGELPLELVAQAAPTSALRAAVRSGQELLSEGNFGADDVAKIQAMANLAERTGDGEPDSAHGEDLVDYFAAGNQYLTTMKALAWIDRRFGLEEFRRLRACLLALEQADILLYIDAKSQGVRF